jgi:2-keto-4-pentenoate hydratase
MCYHNIFYLACPIQKHNKMKNHHLSALLCLWVGLFACNSPQQVTDTAEATNTSLSVDQIADSLQYIRANHLETDIVSRHFPELTREEAFAIQLATLEEELADGARLVGWKMGGTATADEAAFDPIFGYILDRYMIPEGGEVNSEEFPGGSAFVEAEIGFVMKDDLPDGVSSKEELLQHIDQVFGGMELAKGIALPTGEGPPSIDYVLATGMGQVGTIRGSKGVSPTDFDYDNETVKCYVNGQVVAEGKASNIFGNPLNALYELANLLPKQNLYLKAGDIVITGSMYQNPTIDGAAEVRLEFSSLGEINFTSK